MNPWYDDLVKKLGIEHDEKCEDGPACETRYDHVRLIYVPHALKSMVESLQAELAEARAVIEQVGAEATRHSEVVDGCVRVETAYVTQVLSAYHAAPSSALDARDAAKQAEALEEGIAYLATTPAVTIAGKGGAAELLRARAAVLRDTEGKSE